MIIYTKSEWLRCILDKQEYKLRAEEIKSLIAKRDFFNAVKIADEIDWTRVRSVAMLCTISDLYKANRRYKESKNLLLMAYERHPNGRMIVYSLCELCIKMGEVVDAVEYYKQFVQLAPMDNGKYILQYKLYVAQEVRLEERIAVLEELKKRDYREKWGYELAYLYHRMGFITKCVEECDELIIWFSDGKYVKKAMELKMIHEPLTPAQEASYNSFVGRNAELPKTELQTEKSVEEQIKEPSVNVGEFNTIDLQKAIAKSMESVLSPVVSDPVAIQEETGGVTDQIIVPMFQNTSDMKEVYFEDKTDEMAPSSMQAEEIVTDDMQEKTAISKIVEEPAVYENVVKMEEAVASQYIARAEEPIVEEEVISAMAQAKLMPEEIQEDVSTTGAKKIEISLSGVPYEVPMDATKEIPSIREIMVEEKSKTERQITGQMKVGEVLEEWERTKKEYEEKTKAERAKRVLEQTGTMFTEFEAKARDGILEQLEKEKQSEEKVKEETNNEKQAEIQEQPEDEEVFLKEINFEELPEQKNEPEEKAETEELSAEETTIIDEIKSTYPKLDDTAALEKMIQKEKEEEEKFLKEKKEAVTEREEAIRTIQKAQEEIREMSEEEKVLFAPFIQTKGAKRRFMKALDKISLAAYTGNVIVTGEADSDTVKLAKNIMKDIQLTDANFSGVIAKVSGASLNSKSIEGTIAKLNNGGLIIEKASGMNSQAVTKLLKALDQEKTGIVVILEDSKKAMKRMLAAYPSMSAFFNSQVEVEELSNAALASYGRQYAAHLEYSIDDLGMLALQTQIEDRQTSDHIVTVTEVREIVDEAIYRTNRKTIGHFFDIIFGKRYDEDDMIILREKDFN